jgi:UPF0716 protein FxsA
LRAWHALQLDLAEGRIPGRPILDGLSIFVGGALLLTPGLMTDLLGFALLARPTRRWLQNRVINRFGGALLKRGQVYVHSSVGWGARGDTGSQEADRPQGRELDRENETG